MSSVPVGPTNVTVAPAATEPLNSKVALPLIVNSSVPVTAPEMSTVPPVTANVPLPPSVPPPVRSNVHANEGERRARGTPR